MMKKMIAILMVFCCLAVAMPAKAQLIKLGVKGGLNLSERDLKGYNSDNTTGFFIGPMAEVTIPIIGLGIDGALMYSQRGEDDWKQQGIEIPLNLKYTIGLGSMLGIYLAAGPDFFFNFKDVKESDGFKKKDAQVGLNLGAGLKLLRHLQMGANYQIPLNDSFEGNAKTKGWQVSLAYIF